MKQAAIYFCAFAVLLQIYIGVNATDSSSSSTSTENASSNTYNTKTVLEKFIAAVESKASSTSASANATLTKWTQELVDLIDEIDAKVQASNCTTIVALADALQNVGDNMKNTSYRDTYATVAAMSAFIYLVETGVVVPAKLLDAFIDALATLWTPDDTTTSGSWFELFVAKLVKAFKIVETSFAEGVSANLEALIAFAKALYNAVLTEISTTTNVSLSEWSLFLQICGLASSS